MCSCLSVVCESLPTYAPVGVFARMSELGYSCFGALVCADACVNGIPTKLARVLSVSCVPCGQHYT